MGPQTSDATPTEGIRFVESASGQFVGYINDIGPEAKAAGIREVNIWNPPYLLGEKSARLPLPVDTEITLVGDHTRHWEEFKVYVDSAGNYKKVNYLGTNDLKPADIAREDLRVIRGVLERAQRKLPPLS